MTSVKDYWSKPPAEQYAVREKVANPCLEGHCEPATDDIVTDCSVCGAMLVLVPFVEKERVNHATTNH